MTAPIHPHADDETLYEHIAHEIRRGEIRQGLWLKAHVDAEGDDKRAGALYAKYRFTQIRQELQWLHEATIAEVRAKREAFVQALARKGFAVSETEGVWILYAPNRDTTRFSSFDECCHHWEVVLGNNVA